MTTLQHQQSTFVHEFFVAPADRNYLLARIARSVGMQDEFWWQVQQALEKYLKAALVLNGRSVKKGHDLSALFEEHLQVFSELSVTSVDLRPVSSSKLR